MLEVSLKAQQLGICDKWSYYLLFSWEGRILEDVGQGGQGSEWEKLGLLGGSRWKEDFNFG